VLRVAYLARGFAGHTQETEIKPGPRKLMLKIDRGWYTPHATLLGCYVCRATTVPTSTPLAAAAWWGRMFSRRFSLALHTRGCHTAPLPGSHLTCLSSRTVSCPVICRRCYPRRRGRGSVVHEFISGTSMIHGVPISSEGLKVVGTQKRGAGSSAGREQPEKLLWFAGVEGGRWVGWTHPSIERGSSFFGKCGLPLLRELS